MAHAYARHIEVVASAGRQEFQIPLFVNAWLNNPPGIGLAAERKRSGSPTSHWLGRCARHISQRRSPAPCRAHLDGDRTVAGLSGSRHLLRDPRTIFGGFRQVASRLFIPEMRRSSIGVGQMFLAIGQYGAIGVSPFGVDSLAGGDPDEEVWWDAYALLSHAIDLCSAMPGATTRGFTLTSPEESVSFTLGNYVVTVDSVIRSACSSRHFRRTGYSWPERTGRSRRSGAAFV